jgi:hypothetical protein
MGARQSVLGALVSNRLWRCPPDVRTTRCIPSRGDGDARPVAAWRNVKGAGRRSRLEKPEAHAPAAMAWGSGGFGGFGGSFYRGGFFSRGRREGCRHAMGVSAVSAVLAVRFQRGRFFSRGASEGCRDVRSGRGCLAGMRVLLPARRASRGGAMGKSILRSTAEELTLLKSAPPWHTGQSFCASEQDGKNRRLPALHPPFRMQPGTR